MVDDDPLHLGKAFLVSRRKALEGLHVAAMRGYSGTLLPTWEGNGKMNIARLLSFSSGDVNWPSPLSLLAALQALCISSVANIKRILHRKAI